LEARSPQKKSKRGFWHRLPVSWCDHLPNVIYQSYFLFIARRKRPCIVIILELFFKNALVYVVSQPVDVKLRPIWGGPFLPVSRCRKASAHKRRKIKIGVLKSKRRTEKYKTQRRKQVFIEIQSIASHPSQSRLIIADPRAGCEAFLGDVGSPFLNQVAGYRLFEQPSSHFTVRTVLYAYGGSVT
jgi:hypothetical protein